MKVGNRSRRASALGRLALGVWALVLWGFAGLMAACGATAYDSPEEENVGEAQQALCSANFQCGHGGICCTGVCYCGTCNTVCSLPNSNCVPGFDHGHCCTARQDHYCQNGGCTSLL